MGCPNINIPKVCSVITEIGKRNENSRTRKKKGRIRERIWNKKE